MESLLTHPALPTAPALKDAPTPSTSAAASKAAPAPSAQLSAVVPSAASPTKPRDREAVVRQALQKLRAALDDLEGQLSRGGNP
jgi:hypothetical protein